VTAGTPGDTPGDTPDDVAASRAEAPPAAPVSGPVAAPSGGPAALPAAPERPVRLLIVGTGRMARQHAERFAEIPGVTIEACIDTDPGRLGAFREAHGIPLGFASVQEALDWAASTR
jgi:hypothetical protein